MELLFALLAIQTAGVLAAGVYGWRRLRRQQSQIDELREALAVATTKAAGARRRAGAASAEIIPLVSTAGAEAAPRPNFWAGVSAPTITVPTPQLSAETAKGVTLGALAMAPALGFIFGADMAAVVASGLAIGAAMIAIAHRAVWRSAAWAGVATSGVWALIGFAVGSAQAEPISYALCATLAAAAGLAHAHRCRVSPGAAMALIMSVAMLALSVQIGMAGAAGVGYGLIVAACAVTGATSLRLESLHIAAFGAALLGLFVLSGQESAAIWFTPACAWAGAVFFAIAAIRVPQLGARGLAIAGTGAVAPLAAIAGLFISQHGLADRYAAAGGFTLVGALLAGVGVAAAVRRARGLDALKATLWILMGGVFAAFAAAIALALPVALAAPAAALAALGVSALDLGLPARAWRVAAALCSLLSLGFALATGNVLLNETGQWPGWLLAVSGAAAPALLIGVAAAAAKRRDARRSSAFLESVALLLTTFAASLFVRVLYSGGAVVLNPLSFAELGAHAAVWLLIALAARMRARHGARRARIAFANVSLAVSLGVVAVGAALLVTPFWTARQSPMALISRDTFGLLMPAIMLLAHAWLWRSRGAEVQTRVCLAAGPLLLAAFVTLEVTRAEGAAAWLGATVGALSFAAAVGLNFIPGALRQRQLTSR